MPTKYAEVIFEPGSKSVISYDDESELKGFLTEQQNRAVNGLAGGPTGHPAERITKVYLYDQHPGNYGIGDTVDAEETKAAIDAMVTEGAVDVNQLINYLRDSVSAVYPNDLGVHESIYKMEAIGELDLGFLNESAGA